MERESCSVDEELPLEKAGEFWESLSVCCVSRSVLGFDTLGPAVSYVRHVRSSELSLTIWFLNDRRRREFRGSSPGPIMT